MNRAYVSTCQRGEEGVKQLGLTARHLPPFCAQVQTSVRHLGWQQEAAVFRRNFLFLSAGWLWCGSGMALMAFLAEERDEVSVETGNTGVEVGAGGWVFNGCLKTTSLFLVNAKPRILLSFSWVFNWKTGPRKTGVEFVIRLINDLNVWPLALRGINLLAVPHLKNTRFWIGRSRRWIRRKHLNCRAVNT